MAYGLAFGFPRNTTAAAAASPFATLGPTLDLSFVGLSSSGLPNDNDSLDLNFVGNQYSVSAPYMVWSGSSLVPENFQDIITFGRASTGTYINSSGYITTSGINNYLTYSQRFDNAAWTPKNNLDVQTNLLLYSEQFNNAAWIGGGATVTPNVITAPDGNVAADAIVEDGTTGTHRIYQSVTTIGAPTFSVYAKAGTRSWLQLQDISGTKRAWFDLANGVVGTVSAGVTATISAVAGYAGWYRCAVAINTTSTIYLIEAASADNTTTYTGVNGNTALYVWGAQLVIGLTPGDYQATTTTALPVNYLAPDGTLTAQLAVGNGVNAVHEFRQTYTTTTTATGNSEFVFSAYFKQGTDRYAFIYALGRNVTDDNSDITYIDLQTGTITNATGLGTRATITAAPNGYYRVAMPVTGYPNSTNIEVRLAIANTPNVQASTASGGVYMWGAQLEPGSNLGSYWPTTANVYNAPRFDYSPDTRGLGAELVVNGDFSSSTGWTLGAGGVSISAGTAIFSAVNSSTALYRSASVSVGKTYQFTVVVNSVTAGGLQPRLFGGGTPVTITSAGTYTFTDVLTSANSNIGFSTSGTFSGVVESISIKEVTGSAPALRGFLIEEQRTNLLTYSNDFTNVIWSNTNITVTPANTTGPDGTLSGSRLAATAAVGTVFYQTAAVAATSATGSVFAKQGTSATIANTFILRNVTTATDLIGGTLNYSTGVFTYTVGSTGAVITNVGNGWWRVALSATAGITSGDLIRLYVGYGGIVATAGDFLYAYGAQLEAGAFATSYIPTEASQVTRAADVANLNTLSPWFNQRAGSFFISASYTSEITAAGNRGGFFGSVGYATPNSFNAFNGGASTQVFAIFTSTTYPDIGLTANLLTPAYSINKTAFGYNQNNGSYGLSVNGGTTITQTSTQNNATFTTVALGRRDNNVSGLLNGHIQRFSYYPRRLTDAELQTLST